MALGTMPCSNDLFIIMESGTPHGSHDYFKRIMMMPSSPVLYLHYMPSILLEFHWAQ